MRRLILFIFIMSISPSAYATVSTRVCLADGNTPLELADPGIPLVYRPIMVGTHLTIVISSDTSEYWSGELTIWDANRDFGRLYVRELNGSILPAAGEMADIFEAIGVERVDEVDHDSNGFQFLGAEENVMPGDWFIVDYNAIGLSNSSVIFYDFNIDWEHPLYEMFFTHVRTRDFDDDGIVNFKDFGLLCLNWRRTDCQTPENCSGTDLDEDGNVDFDDLKMFADFWLERTR